MNAIAFQWDDADRPAEFAGAPGDCVARAIAIASGAPYRDVFNALAFAGRRERTGSKKRSVSDPRRGVYRYSVKRVLEAMGWVWTPTMGIGTGCRVHLRADELPGGPLIVSLSKHYAAVIDGVLHDMHDCSRGGTRCVYGYWRPGP